MNEKSFKIVLPDIITIFSIETIASKTLFWYQVNLGNFGHLTVTLGEALKAISWYPSMAH